MACLYTGTQKLSPVIIRDYQTATISGIMPTVEIENYTIYTAEDELDALIIEFPETIPTDFIAQINFISGEVETLIDTTGTDVEWFGDNVSEVIGPILRTNCEYSIVFYYTGTTIRGIIQGSSIS